MSYLERLRNRQSGMIDIKKSLQSYRTEPAKPAKGAFEGFAGALHKGTQLFSKLPSPTEPTAIADSQPVAPATAATEPLPNRVAPPAPGSTQPFGQRELDAIKAGSRVWVWSVVLEEWPFWVCNEDCRRKNLARGIDAWRIWTLPELTGVVGFQAQDLRNIAAIHRQFNGIVQPGAVPAQWRNAINRFEPVVVEEGRV